MSSYLSYATFTASAYGASVEVGADSIFATSGACQEFLDYVSSLIDLYAGNTFSTGIIIEEFTAKPGQSKLYLRKFPVHSISSISYYPLDSNTPITVDSSIYRYHSDGRLVFTNTLYGNSVYTVVYTAGYLITPPAIELATMILASSYMLAIENDAVAIPDGGNTTRFVFGKYEENYVDPRQRYDLPDVGIPTTVSAILNRFRYLR